LRNKTRKGGGVGCRVKRLPKIVLLFSPEGQICKKREETKFIILFEGCI
jgi:hypothetical protein